MNLGNRIQGLVVDIECPPNPPRDSPASPNKPISRLSGDCHASPSLLRREMLLLLNFPTRCEQPDNTEKLRRPLGTLG